MRLGRKRARLRVGLASTLWGIEPGTGHGNVWAHVLESLSAVETVRLVRRGRADVWLASAHDPPPTGRPLVVEAHEASWTDAALRPFLYPDFAVHMEACARQSIGVASAVITPSQAARRQVVEAYSIDPARVHAVPHGVDHGVFRPGREGGRELVGSPYVLFVGVLHPRKNLAAVRRALANLAREGRPHVLAIVGSAARDRPDPSALEREALADLPGLPGRVVRLRDVSDRELAALMAGADAFCLPSFFEGFGLPALEAMACGAPVLVSDRGALPEVVGDAALVVEPEPRAVEQALRRILTDAGLRDRLSRAGVQRAAAFTWPNTTAGWLAVLEQAAERG